MWQLSKTEWENLSENLVKTNDQPKLLPILEEIRPKILSVC
jgi:hypothetical protein